MANNKNIKSEHLNQTSIKNFFKPHKGPLKFDLKPLETITARRRKNYRKRKSKKDTKNDELDAEPLSQIEDKLCDATPGNEDATAFKENKTKFSPNIILHGVDEDVEFISETRGQTQDYGSPPKKMKREEVYLKKVCTSFMAVTKSKFQRIEYQNKSRVLQTKKDLFETTNMDSSDVTIIYNYDSATQENIHTASLNVSNTLDEMIEKMTFDIKIDQAEDLQEIENRRLYRLSQIDKIVRCATEPVCYELLFNHERQLLNEFHKMPNNYKFMCCKLFTHIDKWYDFQVFLTKIKLSLSTVEAKAMFSYMKEKNFISTDYTTDSLANLLDLLKVEDVKDIFNSFKLRLKTKKKTDLIKAILNHINTQTTLISTKSLDKILKERIIKKLGICIRINPMFYRMFYKVHLLYSFTNPDLFKPNDLYLFMSRIQNENICASNFTQKEAIFKTAEQFSQFARACECKNELQVAFENKRETSMIELSSTIFDELQSYVENMNMELEMNILAYLRRFSPGYVYASALSFACVHLTKKCPENVKEWLGYLLHKQHFCERKKGVWYCLLAKVQKQYFKDKEGAVRTITAGLSDKKMSAIDINDLVFRGRSLIKKNLNVEPSFIQELTALLDNYPIVYNFPKIIIDAVSNHGGKTGRKSQYKYVNKNGDFEYLSVEEIALKHYTNEEGFSHGIHCEGALVAVIFFVLFWDIIYNPNIKNTFIRDVQRLPLDFYSPDFYINRKELITKRLREIYSDWRMTHLHDYVLETWNIASYNTNSIVNFNIVADGLELYNIILCIGREIVSKICGRLVENFRNHGAGMPDLFVWNNTKCKFVEVKGQGDKLSTKQNLWLDFLKSVGANIEVCHVHTVGNRRGEKYRTADKSIVLKTERK